MSTRRRPVRHPHRDLPSKRSELPRENGIRLEVTSDLDGDEEDPQVIRSCSMTKAELRAELETIGGDRARIDEMVAAMKHPMRSAVERPAPRPT